MSDIRKLLNEIDSLQVKDRDPKLKNKPAEVPLHIPGGSTVCIRNDSQTLHTVVVEAVMAGTGLSEGEATKRMNQAHLNGLAPVACYASRDVAESVATKIEQHARNNHRYDNIKPYAGLKNGEPWPLSCEVLDAGG